MTSSTEDVSKTVNRDLSRDAAPRATSSSALSFGSSSRDESDLLDLRSGRSRHLDSGELRFVSATLRESLRLELEESGFLVACVEGLVPSIRGRLWETLEATIEASLAKRGAGAHGIAPLGAPDASLSDQLYRARHVGSKGIAVALGPLAPLTGALGTLDPADSCTLSFFAQAARERPFVLLLDESDANTAAYGEPIALAKVLAHDPTNDQRRPERPADLARPERPADLARPERPADARAGERPSAHLAGACVVEREEAWRGWTLHLAALRGPQPLITFERAFTESYVPLAHAIANGLDDARARAAHDDFRMTFSKSYTETFQTFAMTTKRPKMVLDAHDIASRLARLHGARAARLLMIDSMRWDLAHMIQERVGAILGAKAVLTEEVILWAALPTTTMRALETLARGIEALRAPSELDEDMEPVRGRTADYVRRLRIGPREVHKLDLVEARLQNTRGNVIKALPEIASTCAEVIARHASALAPRTLLLVFGDHGFEIDRHGCASQGGASPEEVLVGAFALLVGNVH